MSFYSSCLVSINPFVARAGASNSTIVSLRSWRIYGENSASTGFNVTNNGVCQHGTSDTIGSAQTPEKFNSRSPAVTESYGGSGGFSGTNFLYGTLFSGFNHYSWTFGFRYFPVIRDNERFTISSGVAAVAHTTIVTAENELAAPTRRMSRRCREPGVWHSFGSDTISNYQKTGTGAYQIFAPSFACDAYWHDVSAWRNGMSQSDVWNINLLGASGAISEVAAIVFSASETIAGAGAVSVAI